METLATTKLTRAYLQKLDRQNYLATAFAVLIVTFSLFWMLFHIGEDTVAGMFSDVMYSVAGFIGAVFAFTTVYRARRGPLRLSSTHQLAWLLVSLGMLADSIGGFYFAILEQSGQPNPVPSYGDIGFTIFYPCIFLGLLLMPTSLRFRARTALDALITTLCVLGMSWFFFIGPAYVLLKSSSIAIETFIVSLSYPFWDMLLIFAIVMLILQRAEKILRPSLLICGLGILSLIWADTTYAYFTASGSYTSGTPAIDTFWFAASLLIGLSALYQYKAIVNRAYNEMEHPKQTLSQTDALPQQVPDSSRRFLFLRSGLIYFPFAILIALMLFQEITHNEELAFFLVVLTALVGILLTVRYILATYENDVLLHEREQHRQDAEHLRLLGTRLTDVLEFDSLREQIVQIAAKSLTFDAALLLLVDEQQGSSDKHLSGLACTTKVQETETRNLHLVDLEYFKQMHLFENEQEVIWSVSESAVPPEIAQWNAEHNIYATLFIPLVYQGKSSGCLGFASRVKQPFSQRSRTLARAYTQQAATVIEHAQLYQTAVEQEIFAKAMANIATRLNSALLEPAEIHQMICIEAANALRADYALLYCTNEAGQLVPLAAYSDNHDYPLALHEWPVIAHHEQEALMLNNLQPVLVRLKPPHRQLALPSPSLRDRASGVYPAFTPDTTGSKGTHANSSLLHEKLQHKFVKTAIVAPLVTGGEPIGLLILARTAPPGTNEGGDFDHNDVSKAQDFAEQAGVALANSQMYEQQRTAHRRLQELDQLKDQFMITASHELRTPLTAVQGYIELIAQYDEMLPPEQRKEFLQKARRSCDELVVLLGNVMDASRLEMEAGIRPAQMERVNVREMIDSVIDLIEPQLTREKRKVHLAVPPHLAVLADPARLRQVLMNISVNALKYSSPQTPLAFTTRALRIESKQVVVISISDKGKGIAPEDQSRLFERFVRLESDINSPIRGSGLGLYISLRLIKAMDGKIWIESRGIPGEGTTFHIQLPRA